MQCPNCQHAESRVLESRSAEAGHSIRRRRECLHCGHRFTTYERIEFVPVTVIKRNGDRESFDSSKLLRGVVRACEKTGVATKELERLVQDIEAEIQQRTSREVSSATIGELVLTRLQPLNEVAYVRFASVYQNFQGDRDFIGILEMLEQFRLGTGSVHSDDQEPESEAIQLLQAKLQEFDSTLASSR